MNKPCDNCTRVKNPTECENKTCKAWHEWFVMSWEEIRSRFGFRKEK